MNFDTVNVLKLQQEFARREPQAVCGEVDVSASNISSILYECALEGKETGHTYSFNAPGQDRWQQLLKDDDHVRI